MPKREDLKSILIVGAGPIVIGQACEFDYSGAQACKALREEGYRVILVNSNPATIMTDPETADAVYIEPIEWRTVEQIIAQERPDALLPTMGGQTGLNCALDLAREGVLERYGVEMIGASRKAIDMAEDREQFREAMLDIGLEVPGAAIAHSLDEALQKQAAIGFPTIIRPSVSDTKSIGVFLSAPKRATNNAVGADSHFQNSCHHQRTRTLLEERNGFHCALSALPFRLGMTSLVSIQMLNFSINLVKSSKRKRSNNPIKINI